MSVFFVVVVVDWICYVWGIGYVYYVIFYFGVVGEGIGFYFDLFLMIKVVVVGVVFGVVVYVFVEFFYVVFFVYKVILFYVLFWFVFVSIIFIGFLYVLGICEYFGFGVWLFNFGDVMIFSFFCFNYIDYWSWVWKGFFIIVILSVGFKGGEVMFLFFIGVVFGSVFVGVFGVLLDLMVVFGFVVVFVGVMNMLFVCMIMGIEFFGVMYFIYFVVVCFVVYFFSGYLSIYLL